MACYAAEMQNITPESVIRQANGERVKRNITALQANSILNRVAEIRLKDMLENRYFGHTSPTGRDVADIAESMKYDYSCIGENLAKGNFKDANDLVTFWLNSPQHRENLLSRDYRDIGIAVARESIAGHDFWYAVQVFGARSRRAK